MRSCKGLLLGLIAAAAAGCRADESAAPAAAAGATMHQETAGPPPAGFYALAWSTLEGAPAELAAYSGKVALVVNVASQCGLTPQYAGLEALHDELAPRGLVVLGFPCNDFGGQEPGSPEEIRAFCTQRFQVSFPMFAKVQTKAGEGQSELYRHLHAQTGRLPDWNFGKYVVGRDGRVRAYFGPRVQPDDAALRAELEAALAEG